MAGRGPAPKDPAQRRRRNKAESVTELTPVNVMQGPELPDDFEWPAATRTWWDTWRRSAQAQTFVETDWSFLLDTAVMHAEYWLGNRALAGELRLRVAKFGATPEDRARLRLSVGEPKPGAKGPVKGLQQKGGAERQQRLLKVVGDGG